MRHVLQLFYKMTSCFLLKLMNEENNKMKRTIIYIHGKGGNAEEAEAYRTLFPTDTIIGFDYKSQSPWEAIQEYPVFFDSLPKAGGSFVLIANSIGAYYAMQALAGRQLDEAFLISPIVDMERLILDMMYRAGVSEEILMEKGKIPTSSGEILSWDYLCYARENPCFWRVPTHILYGEKDCLTTFDTIVNFSHKIGADLTVMGNGEHWFHTDEQMDFLFSWIRQLL